MARTRRNAAPAPEPEPVVEETSGNKRGPGPLQQAHVAYLKAEYGVDVDPEHLYLAQTTRNEFRDSKFYEDYLAAADERKAKAESAREERRKAKEAAEAQEAPVEEAPKPARTRRSRTAAPAGAEVETPVEAPKPTRSRSRKPAASAAAETAPAETATAPKPRTRKAPF